MGKGKEKRLRLDRIRIILDATIEKEVPDIKPLLKKGKGKTQCQLKKCLLEALGN